MAKKPNRTFKLQSLYLEPGKARLLDHLSEETRVSKQDYLREAVDDLLTKHKAKIGAAGVGKSGSIVSNIIRFKTRNMLKTDRIFDEIARGLGLESFEQLEKQVKIVKDAQRKGRARKPKRKP